MNELSTTVTVVVIHWRAVSDLEEQLRTFQATGIFNVVVVDNSQQLTARQLSKCHPSVRLIANTYNRGFAAAANQGLSVCETEWILFLNPDVKLNGTQLCELVESAQTLGFHAVSPRPQSHNYLKPVPSPLSLLTEFTPIRHLIPLSLFQDTTLTGGCLLIQTQVLNKIGGWDERLFLWFEDSDLTKRLLDEKYRVGWADVPIEHTGGTSFTQISDQQRKDIFFHSMKVYADKHFSWLGRQLTRTIALRYTNRCLLPELNKDLVSLVIPNVKPELLSSFLRDNLPYLGVPNLEVVIVSSGQVERIVAEVQDKLPSIRLIKLRKNKGFAHTVNVGFRVATGSYLATCNDDVVLTSEWLAHLLPKNVPKWGGCNPVIINLDRTIETAGITVEKRGRAVPITSLPENAKHTLLSTDALNAACVVYSRQAIDLVGLFDERFESYLEDIDLSLRMKRADFQLLVNPRLQITHSKHQTSKTIVPYKAWLDCKNWWLVVLKNWTVGDWLRYFPTITVERLRNISGLLKSL